MPKISHIKEASVDNQAQQEQSRRISKKQAPTIPELVLEMKDWFQTLERSVAGYNSLQMSLLSFKGEIPDGERKKGLPIFTFQASVDGHNAIDVVIDMKHADPEYVPHVLIPMINMQSNDLLDAVNEIETRVKMLQQLLETMVNQEEVE